MSGKPRLFLLDAGPVIGLHELGLWHELLERAQVIVPAVVAYKEVVFWDDGGGVGRPIDLRGFGLGPPRLAPKYWEKKVRQRTSPKVAGGRDLAHSRRNGRNMTTTLEQIDLWRQSPSENQSLEFKAVRGQFDNRKLYEYCVALANEGGGHLVLGVSDRVPRQVVGTQAFHDPVAMAEKIFQVVGFRVDVEDVAHPDGGVLMFHIPSRPHGTAYNLEGSQ